MLPSRTFAPARILAFALLSACAAPQRPAGVPAAPAAREEAREGILVMAHGGSEAWNREVSDAVAPLKELRPTALALGMADPHTLQAALDSLSAAGVRRVAVVRLFISGASFLHQTEYLLGLRADPPRFFMSHGAHGPPDASDNHSPPPPLTHELEVRLSREGIGTSPVAARILVDRALAASPDPARRRVVLVAHGMGDDRENQRVVSAMRAVADSLLAHGFRAAEVFTLREDWPDARREAEPRIRAAVLRGARDPDPPLVIPFRVQGFGPYAKVLEGLRYEPAHALLPHPRVTDWLASEAARLLGGGLGRLPPQPPSARMRARAWWTWGWSSGSAAFQASAKAR